ncbi:MAG: diguanylate cyclase, partial [Pseudomonadota bacterium]
ALLAFSDHRLNQELSRLPDHIRAVALGDRDPAGPVSGERALDEPARELEAFAIDVRRSVQERATYEQMALTDPLTGLPNRRGLFSVLDRQSETLGGEDLAAGVGILHVDLDHFKSVNDTFGHDAGDHVLRVATRRMAGAIREYDVLCRLGGDEFVVIAPGVTRVEDISGIAERLISQLEEPIDYDGRHCTIGASIGIALASGDRGNTDLRRLLIFADIALGRAKRSGRNRYVVFGPEMATQTRRRHEVAQALRRGLEREAFRPVFMPVVNPASGALAAFDVTPVWEDDNGVIRTRAEFMDDADASFVAVEIGLSVFAAAGEAITALNREDVTFPAIHMTLTRSQLLSSEIEDRLMWIADDADFAQGMMAIGVSEAVLTQRGCEAIYATLRRLSEHGFEIFIDDFGAASGLIGNIGRSRASFIRTRPEHLSGFQVTDGFVPPADFVGALSALFRTMHVDLMIGGVSDPSYINRMRCESAAGVFGAGIAPALEVEALSRYLNVVGSVRRTG